VSNDKIILDQVLEQQRKKIAPELDASKYFEVFTAEQLIKDFDLSYDELQSGIVAGPADGGMDSFYVFINGELLQEDSDFSEIKKNILIDVFLIQSKTESGFSEAAMDRLISATEDLFDLSRSLKDLTSVYHKSLLNSVERFRNTYQMLASRFPKLSLIYYYATKGEQIHPNVERKVERLKNSVKRLFSASEFSFEFLGARDLLDLARRSPTTTYELKLSENPISSTGAVAFVCLVSLIDFQKFITDTSGHLLRQIFEANVRDYQGKTQVNEEIQTSLRNPGNEDFWWLNNGITVLASKATLSGKKITIENPEVVNGLQTSTEIYTFFSTCNTEREPRNLLVRVIVPNVTESRERIIKATNSQTPIQSASLRATDRIHRDIEEYLKPFGFYYDRRKNHYKNEGKPIHKIVSISLMAQAVMAVVLQQPDTARARPSSLMKRDEDYDRLFNHEYPIEVYRACAQILKSTEDYLNAHADDLSAAHKNNVKFYIAMAVAQMELLKSNPTAKEVASLAGKEISNAALSDAYEIVNSEYYSLGGTDNAAKGKELPSSVKLRLLERLHPPVAEDSPRKKEFNPD
jgi:hypothetical protein